MFGGIHIGEAGFARGSGRSSGNEDSAVVELFVNGCLIGTGPSVADTGVLRPALATGPRDLVGNAKLNPTSNNPREHRTNHHRHAA